MGTDTDAATVPKDVLRAFATLGLAWLDRLPAVGDAIRDAVHPSLRLGDDGVWRPVDAEVAHCYPGGLSLAEALGLTFVVRWEEKVAAYEAECPGSTHRRPIDVALGGRYEAWYPAQPWRWIHVGDDEAARLAGAWYTLRRAARPSVPWRPRDPVAEEFRRLHRAATARLSPAPVTTIRPAVNPGDLGRDWGSRYYRGEY